MELHRVVGFLVVWAVVSPLCAERLYTVSTNFDLVASLDDNPQVSGLTLTNLGFKSAFLPVYASYSTITLDSVGRRGEFRASYSFGLNRIDNSPLDLSYESHNFQSGLTANLTRNLDLGLQESFTHSPDFATSNLLRGILFTEQGAFFDFETIALRRKSYANTASMNLDYRFNPNSSLTVGLNHYLRNFEKSDLSQSGLADQSGLNGIARYVSRINGRTSWNLGYSLSQFRFQEFEDVRTHYLALGLERQITPTVTLSLSFGPSYTEVMSSQSDFLNYRNGSLSIVKTFEDNLLMIAYSRRGGTAAGIGSVSDVQTASLNFSQAVGRRTRLVSNISLYDTQSRLNNPLETRGLSVSQAVNLSLTDQWTLVLGGSYQTQDGNEFLDLERRQVFVSLRLSLPELARFRK